MIVIGSEIEERNRWAEVSEHENKAFISAQLCFVSDYNVCGGKPISDEFSSVVRNKTRLVVYSVGLMLLLPRCGDLELETLWFCPAAATLVTNFLVKIISIFGSTDDHLIISDCFRSGAEKSQIIICPPKLKKFSPITVSCKNIWECFEKCYYLWGLSIDRVYCASTLLWPDSEKVEGSGAISLILITKFNSQLNNKKRLRTHWKHWKNLWGKI